MESLFKDAQGHLKFAYVHENGKNDCRRLIGNNNEEQLFLKWLDSDNPLVYSLYELDKFYKQFQKLSPEERDAIRRRK